MKLHTSESRPSRPRNAARNAALFGMLSAEALALSFLEGLLPSFLPIPGAKPGFSNIVTMYCVDSLGFSYALAVTLFKAFFALLTRGVTAASLSLAGGLLSLLVLTVLFRFGRGKLGYIGIGVLSATAHNLGQLSAAAFFLGKAVFSLAPLLGILGILCGVLTGTVLRYTIPILQKQMRFVTKIPADSSAGSKE